MLSSGRAANSVLPQWIARCVARREPHTGPATRYNIIGSTFRRSTAVVILQFIVVGCGQARDPASEVGTYSLDIRQGPCAAGPYRFSFDNRKWEIDRPVPSEWIDLRVVEGAIVVRGRRHYFVAKGEELLLRQRDPNEFDTTACWISP
jgi:hypothetical protein